MIVDSVSPTPFALLRRANHFQYRDDDPALQEFAEFEDPVKALTEECRRVLRSISSANQSQISSSKESTGLRDASWSRFEDIGFSGTFEEDRDDDDEGNFIKRRPQGLRTTPHSRNVGMGRPTTPSWADFLSSGFVDEAKNGPAPLLLPPDKILPPIDTRGRSSQSHRPRLESDRNLEPGELASITRFDLDDSFWWVWITSLAGEETLDRKAAFGRCALVETDIPHGKWLVMEEMVKGAAPAPEEGAYIAEKKSFWGRSRKNKGAVVRRKSTGKSALDQNQRPGYGGSASQGASKTSIGPDQQARIHAAAMQLQQKQQKQRQQEVMQQQGVGRRGRNEMDAMSTKTSSVFTLQPVIMSEASPAMKWANKYDKDAIREAYLANANSGRGLGQATMQTNGHSHASEDALRPPQIPERESSREKGPAVPSKTPTTPPAPLPPTPPREENPELSEKAAEVALPPEPHPVERSVDRKPVGSVPNSPLPQIKHSMDIPRPSEEQSSPESRKNHNKLKKKDPNSGGFRKMFGRNKATKKPPPNASEAAMNNGNLQPGSAALGRRFSGFKKKSPANSPTTETGSFATPVPVSEGERTPMQSPGPDYGRSYDPSVNSLSRVDTQDAQEAHQAFSNFDQGPLEDVPAFVPDSDHEADDAAPPPISRDRDDELTKTQSHAKDKWAQIRKDAAERAAAAQRESEEQSRGGRSQPTDGDDGDTSGEESKLPFFFSLAVPMLIINSNRIQSR